MNSLSTLPLLRPVLAAIFLSFIGIGFAESARVTATVVSVGDQTITVRQTDGTQTTYDLQAGVMVPSRVEPGMEVTLDVETMDGVQRATSIQLTDSGQLPATASSIWTWSLIGILALAGAWFLKRIRIRSELRV